MATSRQRNLTACPDLDRSSCGQVWLLRKGSEPEARTLPSSKVEWPQKTLCDMAEASRARFVRVVGTWRVGRKIRMQLRKQADQPRTGLYLTKAISSVSFSRPVGSSTRQRRHIGPRSQTPTSPYRDRSSSPWVSTASKQDTGSTLTGACLLKRDHSTTLVSRSRETGWARVAMSQAWLQRMSQHFEIAPGARLRIGLGIACTDRRVAPDGRVS